MQKRVYRRLWQAHHNKLHWVVTLILIANLLGVFNGVVGTLVAQRVAHGLGGAKDTTAQIRAHFVRVDPARARLVGGGGNVDLSYLFGPVLSQEQTNACSSFSLTAILYALRIERGETPATYFSPWYHRFNLVGYSDTYTTMDGAISAVYAPNGGMVYHYRQEYRGRPTPEEYLHADGKSAYYQIFSTGGAGTFNQIAYEVRTGHPVWLLSQVNDGMEYLSSSNPYTDNSGAGHGAHFEVVVGVYGDWLKIRNSWGSAYGQGGYWYLSRYGADTTTLEAAVVSLGADVVWPRVQPLPLPTSTPRPIAPAPTATPRPAVRPTPTRVVVAPVLPLYTLTATHALRAGPRAGSALGRVLRRGWQIRATGRQTPGWISGRTLDGKATGWIARAWVVRAH